MEEALTMSAEHNESEEKWRMALYGVPCDHCYQPAKGLVVFDCTRYVVHENSDFPPCQGPNPEPASPLNFSFPLILPPPDRRRKKKAGTP
jgi:hypothetical protein